MPARRHRFANCRHFGFGVFCHRCALADKLDAKANDPKISAKVAQELKAQATRLRNPHGWTPPTSSEAPTRLPAEET